MSPFVPFALLVAGAAAFTDLRTGHIPNRLTLGALALATSAHVARGAHQAGLSGAVHEGALALLGALACAAVPLLLFWRGGIGGGDVKLFAALGAALHPLTGLELQTYAFVAAALIAPAKLAWDGTLLRTLGNTVALVLNPFRRREARREVPPEMCAWFRLGPSIFVGALAAAAFHLGDLR